MKKSLQFFSFILLILVPGVLFSQFSISAELRPRFEADNGLYKPKPDSINTIYYVSQRTRINFDLKRDKYQARLSFQDVRIWGNGDIYTKTGVWGSTTGVNLKEAWFSFKLGENSSLKIGRQELKLDNQRLIAIRNWSQYGLSYDALVYKLQKNSWELSAALSYNNSINVASGKVVEFGDLFNNTNIQKTLNYLHFKKSFKNNLVASIVAIGSGYQHPVNQGIIYMTVTYGLWLKYNNSRFDASLNAYLQNGKAQSGKNVNAYLFAIDLGIKVKTIRIGLGWDYISGDNANNSDYGTSEKTFNKLYGAMIKFNGAMNYYTYMKSSTANGGLMDLYPNLTVPINKKHSLTVYYHKFWLANSVLIGGTIIDDKNMGSEVDLKYTYKILKDVTMKAGVSYYITTETLKKVRGVSTTSIHSPYWAWVMITFSPELFSSK